MLKVKKKNGEGIQNEYQQILIIVIGFLVLFTLFRKKSFGHYFLYVSIGTGIISLISKRFMGYILWIWEKIGFVLGFINSRILLGIIFYLILSPIALLYRLFNKDEMDIKSNRKSSMFRERNHLFVKKDLEDVF